MANADFDRSDPGFASQAFGTADACESPVQTPLQRRLAAAEAHLPAPLTKPGGGCGAVPGADAGRRSGPGRSKAPGAYNQAKNWYTAGVPADGGTPSARSWLSGEYGSQCADHRPESGPGRQPGVPGGADCFAAVCGLPCQRTSARRDAHDVRSQCSSGGGQSTSCTQRCSSGRKTL